MNQLISNILSLFYIFLSFILCLFSFYYSSFKFAEILAVAIASHHHYFSKITISIINKDYYFKIIFEQKQKFNIKQKNPNIKQKNSHIYAQKRNVYLTMMQLEPYNPLLKDQNY